MLLKRGDPESAWQPTPQAGFPRVCLTISLQGAVSQPELVGLCGLSLARSLAQSRPSGKRIAEFILNRPFL